ncbi:MAG: threonylcarbamoyl-AMP synthase [Clostridiales bacterium]|nr:threonylcarbamoyl-AMP synthase [Clostridiales bacterium]
MISSGEAKTYNTLCLSPTKESLQAGANYLQAGELVAFPTETVYGLGADGLNPQAVKKIFLAKQRPMDNPLILHIARIQDAFPLCHITPLALTLMEAFWPGPLTLLLSKTEKVPSVTTGGLSTVALRMPEHPVALELISLAGCPVAAPSANRSGRPSPTKAEHVFEDLQGRIPLILNGGSSSIGLESTVLDISTPTPNIFRPGAVTYEMLEPYCKNLSVSESVLAPLAENTYAPSPGMRYKHYAPTGSLTLVEGKEENVIISCKSLYDKALQQKKKAAIFSFSEHLSAYGNRYVVDLGSQLRLDEPAKNLFDALRKMDSEKIDVIFSEVIPPKGLGLAVMNRLGRAAAFHTIDADYQTNN